MREEADRREGAPVATAVTGRGRRRTLTQRDARLGLSLMSPTLLIVLVIIVFPLLWSILISFQRLRLIEIGRADFFRPLTLANYERVISS
jgi:multiple sugar transport system permease protein